MANYTAISEVGKGLVDLLRDKMVPEVVLNPENIGLCSPDDKGDLQVTVFLYDIKESENFRDSTMVQVDARNQKYPSTYLSLYYMITAFVEGELKHRNAEEHRVLGSIVQTLNDNSVLQHLSDEVALQIEMVQLSIEDKMKIWTVPEKAYKVSLFYRVTPVEIESVKTKRVQRVVDIDFTVKEQK